METKNELVAGIIDLCDRALQRLGDEDADERTFMGDQCSPAAQEALGAMSVDALHLLDAIPTDESDRDAATINVMGLSQATGVPKGTVSKRLQRLVEIGVVTRSRRPGNRKEVHLRLTPIGREIQTAHRRLHEQMGAVPDEFLSRYSTDELEVITRVLGDFVRMPREGLRFRPDLLD